MVREILDQIGRLFAWAVTVAPWEQAIRVRAGKHTRLLKAGIYLRIPFLDRVYRQSTRRRLNVVAQQTITTKDGRAVTIAGSVGYSVKDLRKLFETLHDAVDTIECEAAGLIAEYVVTHNLRDCSPSGLAEYVNEKLDLKRYGLGDQQVIISTFAAVRTYRLMMGSPREWKVGGDCLDTVTESGPRR